MCFTMAQALATNRLPSTRTLGQGVREEARRNAWMHTRIVAFDASGCVTRLEEAGRRFAAEVGLPIEIGATPDQAGLERMVERMAERLFEAISQPKLSAETASLLRLDPLRNAAKPDVAKPLFDLFVQQLSTELGKPIPTGVFGADMQVSLVNDGPVTVVLY
jgi:hypothetical protein